MNEHNPGYNGPALVGAYQEHVFMLERGNPIEGEHAKVLELGPGGNTASCPKGSATKPLAEALGQKLASFPIADKLTLSSKLQQVNAVSTEWELEPGVTQTVAQRQREVTKVEYQFKQEGTFKVLARITTDDLATPELEVSENVTIVAPKIKSELPTPGEKAASLKAEVNPTGAKPTANSRSSNDKSFTDSSTKKIPCPTKPGEGESWVVESVNAEGLVEGTHYRFRLLAKAGAWESKQAGTEFETHSKGAPEAETKPAGEIGNSATLNGAVNPKGKETKSCTFEYGTALPSGKTVPCSSSPGKGEAAVAVSAKVAGLTGSTPYKFKLIDESTESKKAEGAVQSFTTLEEAKAPAAEAFKPLSLTQTTATLAGLVNPHGALTECVFEYGTSMSYGSTVPCPASLEKAGEVSAAVSGLAPGTSITTA